jgi:hypothetical protein
MQRKTAQITPWVDIWAPKCRATARNQGRPFGSLRKSLRSASGSGSIWGIPDGWSKILRQRTDGVAGPKVDYGRRLGKCVLRCRMETYHEQWLEG